MGTNPRIIDWSGISGSRYRHEIFPIGTAFNAVAGNYIYAKETKPGSWSPLYIGETDNLGERLGRHEMEPLACALGATHVHVHATVGGTDVRRREEQDLISKWMPPCNTKGK